MASFSSNLWPYNISQVNYREHFDYFLILEILLEINIVFEKASTIVISKLTHDLDQFMLLFFIKNLSAIGKFTFLREAKSTNRYISISDEFILTCYSRFENRFMQIFCD